MKKVLTLPKGLPDAELDAIKDTIGGWHIVWKTQREGLQISWEQTVGYGAGAESLSAYLEGLLTGLRVVNPKKPARVDTFFEKESS